MTRVSTRLLVTALSICVMLLFSCNEVDDLSVGIRGSWSIDTIYYNGQEIRYCLDLNTINFIEEGAILPTVLPNNCSDIPSASSKQGSWEIYKSDSVPVALKITSDNNMFDGSHQVVFRKDPENKLLKMEIRSANLQVVCRKFLFNYDSNIELMDRLVQLSNGK